MPQKVLAGRAIDLDEEGYLLDWHMWTKQLAQELALEDGLTLENDHWQVITYLQNEYHSTGRFPSFRRLCKIGSFSSQYLYQLFPGGPLKKAARIAGLPKPPACV